MSAAIGQPSAASGGPELHNREHVVHLVRHGEVYNPEHVLYGRLPGFHLSDLGIEQAKKAAAFLADRDISYIVASPLDRAQQTAQPLAAELGLSVNTDERLIEADNHLQGKQVAGGRGLFTDVTNWKYFRNPLRPSWGEPYAEIASRVLAAARAARDAADGHEAVCVSHQLPIWVARRQVQGERLFHDPRKRQCALASVTSFTFIRDVVVRVDYAEPAGVQPSNAVPGA